MPLCHVNPNRQTAENTVKNLTKQGVVNGAHNGSADAVRHAYWSALNARDLGYDLAKKFGDAHEDYPDNPEEEKNMDLINNEEGYAIGDANRNASDQEILELVLNAFRNFDLQLGKTNEKVIPKKQSQKKVIVLPELPDSDSFQIQ